MSQLVTDQQVIIICAAQNRAVWIHIAAFISFICSLSIWQQSKLFGKEKCARYMPSTEQKGQSEQLSGE